MGTQLTSDDWVEECVDVDGWIIAVDLCMVSLLPLQFSSRFSASFLHAAISPYNLKSLHAGHNAFILEHIWHFIDFVFFDIHPFVSECLFPTLPSTNIYWCFQAMLKCHTVCEAFPFVQWDLNMCSIVYCPVPLISIKVFIPWIMSVSASKMGR